MVSGTVCKYRSFRSLSRTLIISSGNANITFFITIPYTDIFLWINTDISMGVYPYISMDIHFMVNINEYRERLLRCRYVRWRFLYIIFSGYFIKKVIKILMFLLRGFGLVNMSTIPRNNKCGS